MITEQFSTAPLTKTRSFLILFVCLFSFFSFFFLGGGGGGFLNSESREKNYSALDVLLVIHIQAQGPNSKGATKNEGR